MPKTDELTQRLKKYDHTYEDFTDIMNNYGWLEKSLVGEKFQIWKLSALYAFAINPKIDTDLAYYADIIKSNFIVKVQNICQAIEDNPHSIEAEWVNYIYYGTGDIKYLEILTNNNNIDLSAIKDKFCDLQSIQIV